MDENEDKTEEVLVSVVPVDAEQVRKVFGFTLGNHELCRGATSFDLGTRLSKEDNLRPIRDISRNKRTRFVSIFKDYLIWDDPTDFLKRFFPRSAAKKRLKTMCKFWTSNAHVFPNYIALPERKIIFANIRKKQNFVDEKIRTLARQAQYEGKEPQDKSLLLKRSFIEEVKREKTLREDSLEDSSGEDEEPKIDNFANPFTQLLHRLDSVPLEKSV